MAPSCNSDQSDCLFTDVSFFRCPVHVSLPWACILIRSMRQRDSRAQGSLHPVSTSFSVSPWLWFRLQIKTGQLRLLLSLPASSDKHCHSWCSFNGHHWCCTLWFSRLIYKTFQNPWFGSSKHGISKWVQCSVWVDGATHSTSL